MSKQDTFGWLCSLICLTSGCAAAGGGPTPDREDIVQVGVTPQAALAQGFGSVALELVDGATLDTARAALPLLAGRGIALALHWPAESIDDPARWELVDEAIAMGVEIHPWLTLPEAHGDDQIPGSPGYSTTGYFPNATNFDSWIGTSQYLMFLWRQRGLPATTMVVDLEIRKERLLQLNQLLGADVDAAELRTFLQAGIDRERYAAARVAFHEYVDYAHRLGFKVNASILLALLDDYSDGDDDLRQAFGVPLDDAPQSAGAIPWDQVSFQAHRTLYAADVPGLSAFMVYDYGRMARERFGPTVGLDIGLTHGGIDPNAALYADGNDMRRDVEAALAAGIPAERIGVYSLLGMLRNGAFTDWVQPAQAVTPAWNPQTAVVHGSSIFMDSL